jgi:hypothetical protein
VTQTIRTERPAGPIPTDAFVLQNRELRDNVVLETTSRFADDIWVLSPAVHQVHARNPWVFSSPWPSSGNLLPQEEEDQGYGRRVDHHSGHHNNHDRDDPGVAPALETTAAAPTISTARRDWSRTSTTGGSNPRPTDYESLVSARATRPNGWPERIKSPGRHQI